MTDSWTEYQAEVERSRRHARANQNIFNLNQEIAAYEAAKSAVQNVKNKCGIKKDEWKPLYMQLSEKDILKKDIFEGEMAKKLEEYLDHAIEENQNGINAAQALINALGDQITMIDNKIAELNNDIGYWQSQLYW